MALVGRSLVPTTMESRRVAALPRRTWLDSELDKLARDMTEALARRGGTMSLRPLQALALHDIGVYGGAFCSLQVGGGKTLISLLAPYVVESRRPVLIVPAALKGKTQKDMREMSMHWRIPQNFRVISFEELGRVKGMNLLEGAYQPDLIVVDEVHRLKNPKASVTRRVTRYMEAHPETKFVAMSGTVMKDSIRDFAHILAWCLKDGAPVPNELGEILAWSNALDDGVNFLTRLDPGPILAMGKPEDIDPNDDLGSARRCFRRRLTETPGVVASSGSSCDASIRITSLTYTPTDTTDNHYTKLRTTALTPDDWDLMEAIEVWQCARQLALGFHYVWDPRPPPEWRAARKAWASLVREVLKSHEIADSELQVRHLFRDSHPVAAATGAQAAYHEWNRLKPTFTPNSKIVWHDDTALKACEKWAHDNGPGIIWTEHSYFGREVAKRLKLDYFGQGGLNSRGEMIDNVSGKHTIVASMLANGTGRNLQMYSRALVTSPPSDAKVWEQLLGRLHRQGQKADEISFDVFQVCAEHCKAWVDVLQGARAAVDILGQDQKVLYADSDMLSHPPARGRTPGAHSRWYSKLD